MPFELPDFTYSPLATRPRALPAPSFGNELRYELRTRLEHFVVDEVPVYMPNGQGEHIFLHLRKRGISTPVLLRRFRHLGINDRDLGFAGRKDERGVTSQWLSLPFSKLAGEMKRRIVALEQLQPVNGHPPTYLQDKDHAEVLASGHALLLGDEVDILQVTRHPRKLRLGHLAGNRFSLGIQLFGAKPQDLVEEIKERADVLMNQGFPNYFGDQRFGYEGDSLQRAVEFMRRGKKPSRSRNETFLVSVWQSAIFNQWLTERVQDGLLQQAIEGDVLEKEPRGANFVCSDPDVDTGRIMSGEVSPTGPLLGADMRACTHEALTRESRSCAALAIDPAICTSHPALKLGARRKAKAQVNMIEVTPNSDLLQVEFTLPPGSYATVFIHELLGVSGGDALVSQGSSDSANEVL